jgi:hypothetical protein
LNLSVEHSGFTFQSDPAKIVDMLQHHSGGKVAEAFRMAIRDDESSSRNTLDFHIASEQALQEDTTITAAPMEEIATAKEEEEEDNEDHVPTDKTSRSLDIPPKREVRSRFCCC